MKRLWTKSTSLEPVITRTWTVTIPIQLYRTSKWANFGSVRFYHSKTSLHLFTALSYVHDFRLKIIQSNKIYLHDNLKISLNFWIKLDLIKALTTNSLRSLNIVELDLLLWLRFDLVALQYFLPLLNPIKPKQKIKLNNIESFVTYDTGNIQIEQI